MVLGLKEAESERRIGDAGGLTATVAAAEGGRTHERGSVPEPRS